MFSSLYWHDSTAAYGDRWWRSFGSHYENSTSLIEIIWRSESEGMYFHSDRSNLSVDDDMEGYVIDSESRTWSYFYKDLVAWRQFWWWWSYEGGYWNEEQMIDTQNDWSACRVRIDGSVIIYIELGLGSVIIILKQAVLFPWNHRCIKVCSYTSRQVYSVDEWYFPEFIEHWLPDTEKGNCVILI